MKSATIPSTEPLGPFPLETNLRKLKPRLTKLGPVIAGLTIMIAQEGFWRQVKEWGGTTSGIVIIGLFASVLVFYLLDLYLKQIWYNERGIGIAKAWGGNRTWYSFDEMRGGQFKMRRRTHGPGQRTRVYKPTSRLVLVFQSGSVRLWPNMYDSKGFYDLLSILSRRFPDSYAPPVPPEPSKKDKLKEMLQQSESSGSKKNEMSSWIKQNQGKTTNPDASPVKDKPVSTSNPLTDNKPRKKGF